MHRPVRNGLPALMGKKATVLEVSGHEYRVETHAEIWWAIASRPVHVGQAVRITGGNGLELEVEPLIQSKEGTDESLRTVRGRTHCKTV